MVIFFKFGAKFFTQFYILASKKARKFIFAIWPTVQCLEIRHTHVSFSFAGGDSSEQFLPDLSNNATDLPPPLSVG